MKKTNSVPSRDLLCFSHLRWNFVFQRPQHLLSRAAKTYRVHFVEEARSENVVKPHLDISTSPDGVSVVVPVLPDNADPTDRDPMVRRLIQDYLARSCPAPAVGWYYTPMALRFTSQLRFPVIVYDCMDELSCFKGAPPDLVPLERQLMRRAQVVFTGGFSLFDAKRQLHPNVHAFPSSVDVAHFLPARSKRLREPSDIEGIPHPRIGFFGVIDERLDTDLVEQMAIARPDWHFVMIGPVVKIDQATLPRRANIHWLGGKGYGELPSYLSALDVGFMPFARNDATRFISPTKTPEFLAAGLPVVSTPITDVVRTWGENGFVEIAPDAATAVSSVETLLARKDRPAWLARVDRQLASNSWDATWSAMRDRIEQAGSPGLVKPKTTNSTRERELQVSHV